MTSTEEGGDKGSTETLLLHLLSSAMAGRGVAMGKAVRKCGGSLPNLLKSVRGPSEMHDHRSVQAVFVNILSHSGTGH